jgi:hypothetical protein
MELLGDLNFFLYVSESKKNKVPSNENVPETAQKIYKLCRRIVLTFFPLPFISKPGSAT